MATKRLRMAAIRVKQVAPRRQERKLTDGFYMTREWREARALSIAMHAYRCAKCGRRASVLYVDHKVELRDGGAPLDQGNLEPLCGSCHTTKTLAVQKIRAGA